MYFNKNHCFLSHSLVESLTVNISRGLHLLCVCVCVCVCVCARVRAGVVSAGFPGSTVVKESDCQCASAGDATDAGSVPGSGGSAGGGNGSPLQYSCLENPIEDPGELQSMGS